MKLTIENKELDSWLELVQSAKLTYFKVRQECFDKLMALLLPQSGASETTSTLTSEAFRTLKSYLTSRNDKLTDDKTLAFEKTLAELETLSQSGVTMHLAKAARSEPTSRAVSRAGDEDDSPDENGDKGDKKKEKPTPRASSRKLDLPSEV
jgi:hypothetical protein